MNSTAAQLSGLGLIKQQMYADDGASLQQGEYEAPVVRERLTYVTTGTIFNRETPLQHLTKALDTVKKVKQNIDRGFGGLGALYGAQDDLRAQILKTQEYATKFYAEIKSKYGDGGFADPEAQEIIKGITYILGPHFIGIDKKVHRINQVIKQETVDAQLAPLVEQLRNMTDDDARTDEWQKEENTLFAKAAIYFHPDYVYYKDQFENYVYKQGGHQPNAESYNMFYGDSPEYVKAVIDLGQEMIKNHPAMRPIYDAARDWRGESTKFKITDVFGPLLPFTLLFREVIGNENVALWFEKANKIALIVGATAIATIITAGAGAAILGPAVGAGLTAVIAGVVGVLAKLATGEFKDPGSINLDPVLQNIASEGQKKLAIQNQASLPGSNILSNITEGFKNLQPTHVIGGISALAFFGLLFMGAAEQKKVNKKHSK